MPSVPAPATPSAKRPNVILVITDDQGYGDLGCTGNPWLKTPNLDAFHDTALRFRDFHVQPMCTPTRGAIMTGRRPLRNGAWATCWGRSILKKSETTLADVFRDGGYRTAMFGKWHLGDNVPYRPFDRGFETVVAHKGGGVGQTPDFWGNNYFDDTYFHNGLAVEHEGYCTDVWFKEALQFIEENRDRPFFVYLATNAPHDPFLVGEHYKRPYLNNPAIQEPGFYGMIANIDENFGALRRKLAELNLENDTVLIFMTDNGTSGGCRTGRDGRLVSGFNAGMRGQKCSYYDGGHRVPFFIRWPAAGIGLQGKTVPEMGLDLDILPTLVDLCGLRATAALAGDGESLAPILRGEADRLPGDRVNFLQYHQGLGLPEKWENAVMTRRWRLVHGTELYDITTDPGQERDLAAAHPEVVQRLRAEHERWWKDVEPNLTRYCPIHLGDDRENPTRLDAMDVMGDVVWHQTAIVLAQKSSGRWNVDVRKTGNYRFSLRRWPAELGLPLDAGVSETDARSHIYAGASGASVRITPVSARLKLFDREVAAPVGAGDLETVFELELDRTGETCLEAWFADASGEERGAYYVYVLRKPDGAEPEGITS